MAATKPVKRIKLDSKKSSSKKEKVDKKTTTKVATPTKKKVRTTPKAAQVVALPFVGISNYVVGSWNELRQVRWPNRSATWGLTFAVIAFTVFFTIIILVLDAGFQYLFKEVLLK